MMRKITTVCALLLIISMSLVLVVNAAGSPWSALVREASLRLRAAQHQVAVVTSHDGNTVFLQTGDPSVAVGTLLVVKARSRPGLALALQDDAAVVKVVNRVGSQVRGIVLVDYLPVVSGMSVFPFTYNMIYVYSNVRQPHQYPPYNDLISVLQRQRLPYQEKKYAQLRNPLPAGMRPLIIRLESVAANVVGRLTDETGTIYLAQSFAVGVAPPLDIGFNAPFALREQTFSSQRSPALSAGLQAGDFRKPTQKGMQKQTSAKIKLMGVYARFVCADVDGN
ncbi:MAG: hypothetical protein J7L69_01130, partial [Desulfobulbaceae bacterium]|nr:hypothetical protein [Desulfobulbaceae bacterium]